MVVPPIDVLFTVKREDVDAVLGINLVDSSTCGSISFSRSFSAEHDDTPLGKIDVELSVRLGPGLVKRVTGAIPPTERGVLGAENLRPLTGMSTGSYAITII